MGNIVKRPTYFCEASEILTLDSFFRADKDRQRFGSSDDSHVTYISAFKKSPSILNELVGIYEGWNFNSGNYLFTNDTK